MKERDFHSSECFLVDKVDGTSRVNEYLRYVAVSYGQSDDEWIVVW